MKKERSGGILSILIAFTAFVLMSIPCYAIGMDVQGTIDEDTTWAKANSPFMITDDIVVAESVTLTIEANVKVVFHGGKKMEVAGTLVAQGTEEDPIYFTSAAETPSAGDWKGIFFLDSSADATFDVENYQTGSIIEYAVVEYAEKGISANSASPFISRNFIRKNLLGIDLKSNANSIVTGNLIYENTGAGGDQTGGINIAQALPEIKSNTFTNNTGSNASAITYWGTGELSITDCYFKDNQSIGGGAIKCVAGSLNVSGSNFTGNTDYAIYNESLTDSKAQGCYWGTGEIASVIYGTVDTSNPLDTKNENAGTSIILKGSLHVTVKDIVTSAPIQEATITSDKLTTSGSTDANGDFLANIDPATVSMVVSADGYITTDPITAVIKSGETTSKIIYLIPYNASVLSLSGTIMDAITKNKVFGINVKIDDLEPVATDEDGVFTLNTVISEMDHTLVVSGGNYLPLRINVNIYTDESGFNIYLTPTANLYNSLTVTSGWNLISLNNFSTKTISIAFGDDSLNKIESVWAWSENKWKVYLPQKSQEDLEAYTTAKGFSILNEIPKGSGIWVNALEAFNLEIQ